MLTWRVPVEALVSRINLEMHIWKEKRGRHENRRSWMSIGQLFEEIVSTKRCFVLTPLKQDSSEIQCIVCRLTNSLQNAGCSKRKGYDIFHAISVSHGGHYGAFCITVINTLLQRSLNINLWWNVQIQFFFTELKLFISQPCRSPFTQPHTS